MSQSLLNRLASPAENSVETVGRIQNLKPWPKGVSGNPAGRPKNDISVELAQAVFENNPEAIYQGMLRKLKKGDARVFKVLADRAYGKLKVQIEAGLFSVHRRAAQGGSLARPRKSQ